MVLGIPPSAAAIRHFSPPPRVLPIEEAENTTLLENAERIVALAEDECRSIFCCRCCQTENASTTRLEQEDQELE